MTDALNMISEQAQQYDAVVIIRGGGSVTDLSWFDSYEIAFHVTQFPLPVLTGIGHEKDVSVTDMVAWKSLKTPTAVADFLVEQTGGSENRIIVMAGALTKAATEAIAAAGEHLASLQNRTAATARLIIRVRSDNLNYHTETLRRSGTMVLRAASELTDRMESALRHLDPAGVLKRGFTLTAKNGIIVRTPEELMPGDTITTHFEKGEATSKIINTNKKR